MTDDARVQQRMERIAELVRRLDTEAGSKGKEQSKELVELVMSLHGEAFERILERLRAGGEAGAEIIHSLAADPVISSVLLLYGLHPVDLETRVRRALDKLRPTIRSYGGDLELAGCENGDVRVRLTGLSTSQAARAARSAIEEALYAAVPDAASLVLLGLEKFPSPDFVPLENVGILAGQSSG
jgi:Fe-S cluster biogenesis protein NfuA